MALKLRKEENLTFSEQFDIFFKLPEEDEIQTPIDDYEELKEKIYKLKIDKEEKANIINLIGSLKTKNDFEKNKIKKEIETFKDKYNL